MAYNKTNWQNLPSRDTPIVANNLNKMEEGIYQNSLKTDQVGDLTTLETTSKSNLVGAINETIVDYVTGEEIPLNEYLGGKRVYARVYEGNVPAAAKTASTPIVDLSSINYDKVWLDNTNSWYFINNNTSVLTINWFYNTNDWCRTYVYGNNKRVEVKLGSNTTSDIFHITVKYTKASV